MEKKWYIINVQTGCESTAKSSIEEKIKTQKVEDYFGQVLIPAENVVELVKGQKRKNRESFFLDIFLFKCILRKKLGI